ncbi:glycosyl hydrolase family 28-related protein [Jiangella gansuensis]|uniref:glycosyl hydrolase family 28-related protein n=1 Tax=Jiangella gansuensis TaxID=281473 RepID=UPI0012FB7398|nr:glycosyl hydrolase family 28-related protein [Jiangella gansuensis]
MMVAESLTELVGIVSPVDGQAAYLDSYFPIAAYSASARAIGELGGGVFVWRADVPRDQHNGGSVISPTVPGAGDPAVLADYLSGAGETHAGFNGCWVRDLDGALNPTWFGARVDADLDNSASLAALVSAAVASGGRDILFPRGTLQYSQSPNFGYSHMRMIGSGPSNSVLKYTGADKALIIDASEFGPSFIYGLTLADLTVEGNSNAQSLVYCEQAAHMRITDVALREADSATGVALELRGAVACRVENVVCSINEQPMVSRPSKGILLGRLIARPEHFQCSTNTFVDVIIEAATDIGIHLQASDQAMFFGGTSEANLGGKGVVIDDVCRYNSFIGMGCEANALGDFINSGTSTQFINCYSSTSIEMLPSARHAVIEGGMYHRIDIAAGAKFTAARRLAYGYWSADGAGFFDDGNYTSVEGLMDMRAAESPGDPSPWGGNYVSQLGAPTVVAPTSSPHTVTNTSGGTLTVTVAGGTVDSIELARDGAATVVGGGSSGLPGEGTFALAPTDALKITYSATPSVLTIEGQA